MWVNNDGTNWVPLSKPIQVQDVGWRPEKAKWICTSPGVWKQLVPTNAIILYASAPAKVQICNGANNTPNLLDRYLRIDGNLNPLYLGGNSLTHSGSTHGASSAAGTNPVYNVQGETAVSLTDGASDTYTSHTHSVGVHTHSTATYTPSIPTVGLIPTVGGDKIYSGAIIPTTTTVTSSFLNSLASDPAFVNTYIKLTGTYDYSGASNVFNHEHASYTMNTTEYTTTNVSQKQTNNYTWGYVHRHTANHTMGSATAAGLSNNITTGPLSTGVFPYQANKDMYFDDLPSGSVCLFMTTDIPAGWTELVTARMLRFKGSTSLYESDEHHHTGGKTTGGVTIVTSKCGSPQTKAGEYVIGAHTHSWTDSHIDTYTTIPLYVVLVVAYKN